MKNTIYSFFIFLLLGLLTWSSCQEKTIENKPLERRETQSGAGQALEFWGRVRAYPTGEINAHKWSEAYHAQQSSVQRRTFTDQAAWEPIGPKNFGGRTLSMAFHPTNPAVIWIGAAGGGLWKTTTAGVGYVGWERVETGFPVIGVPAIVINPNNADEMYIGTGEVYNNEEAMPGIINRLTRGTYGIGILKTTDGGETWSKTLDWAYNELTGVSDMAYNPENTDIVFAATTEGLYRTQNAGETWEQIFDVPMVTDVHIKSDEPNVVLVAVGNLFDLQSGVYRSTDGGNTFELLSNGLPTSYSGKARIKASLSSPEIMVISMADALNSSNVASHGLYKSTDGGVSWALINTTNVPRYQGWYSHDAAIKPDDDNTILWAGIDTYKTTDNGATLHQKTYWYAWDFGQTPVGGSEGPPDYVHADVHGLYFSPFSPNHVWSLNDGGVFFSADAGETWEGRNGSYQSQQFYANFSSSVTNPDLAIGGMQDNATAIYRGGDSWERVIGGDGMNTAISTQNESILFGSYQNLSMRRSTNGGDNFSNVSPSQAADEYRCFNSPFELSNGEVERLYAGAQHLFISDDYGDSWNTTSAGFVDGDNPILTIGLSSLSDDLIYVSTVPNPNFSNPAPGKVLRSIDGGATWEVMTDLPNRICMDIAVHPEDDNIALAVFSGFGEPQLWKTTDQGESWMALDNDLPDVPANCILFNPFTPEHVYLGTDLGVWFSDDGGEENWEPFMEGLPAGVFAMSLSICETQQLIRVATHGHGVYESELAQPDATAEVWGDYAVLTVSVYPNPATDEIQARFDSQSYQKVAWTITNGAGQVLQAASNVSVIKGENQLTIPLENMATGTYYLNVSTEKEGAVVQSFVVQ